jgi:hypothetical protein
VLFLFTSKLFKFSQSRRFPLYSRIFKNLQQLFLPYRNAVSHTQGTTMSYARPQTWSSFSEHPLSHEALLNYYREQKQFQMKFYPNSYAADQNIALKGAHNFIVYILSGGCEINVNKAPVALTAGEFLELNAGEYALSTQSEGVELIKVFSTR